MVTERLSLKRFRMNYLGDVPSSGSACDASSTRAYVSAMAVLLLAVAVSAQLTEKSRFSTSSVKLMPGFRYYSFTAISALPGGRFRATASLKRLIMHAYGLQEKELVGGPDWINTDYYQVEGKAQGNPSREGLMAMLQTLLEQRFQLKTHPEMRVGPVYNLAQAKSGAKLTPTGPDRCTSTETSPWERSHGRVIAPCGKLGVSPSRWTVSVQGYAVPIRELVRTLASLVDRPVLDRTKLAGSYDISLEFMDDPDGSDEQSLFTALEEQLGLRLVPAKGPIKVLVIDRVERAITD